MGTLPTSALGGSFLDVLKSCDKGDKSWTFHAKYVLLLLLKGHTPRCSGGTSGFRALCSWRCLGNSPFEASMISTSSFYLIFSLCFGFGAIRDYFWALHSGFTPLWCPDDPTECQRSEDQSVCYLQDKGLSQCAVTWPLFIFFCLPRTGLDQVQ